MSESKTERTTYPLKALGTSQWSIKTRIAIVIWEFAWAVLCRWTPKPFNPWRLACLRLFGAKIEGTPFVHQRARINIPWNLWLQDRACLGDGANAYALGAIELHAGATIAQEAYLCTGTHDFGDPLLPLQTAKIVVERAAFVGARAFVLPGITIGEGAIVGACAVVTKDVQPWNIVTGNPAKPSERKRAILPQGSSRGDYGC